MSEKEDSVLVMKEFSETQIFILVAPLKRCVTEERFAEGVRYVRNHFKEFA